jgi:hypothetical protein
MPQLNIWQLCYWSQCGIPKTKDQSPSTPATIAKGPKIPKKNIPKLPSFIANHIQ